MAAKAELTEGERRFVLQVIGEEPVYVEWIEKVNKKGKSQKRLLAVGKYRIYSIKRTKGGKKQIVREGHLFGLREIYSDDIDRVSLIFKDFRIMAGAPGIGLEIPRLLLDCFNLVSWGFPPTAIPRLVLLPEGRNPPTLDPVVPGIAGGIIETYLAHCDFTGIPPSQEIFTHIEDIYGAELRKLKLDTFIGIAKDSEFAFNLTPLMNALRHNTYFTIFKCREQSRKEIIPLLADVIAHNSTLTRVDLSGVECEEGWGAPLAEALQNKQSSITELLIANAPIGGGSNVDKADKAAASFAHSIGNINHSLTTLKLSNTKLQPAGLGAIFRALSSNYVTSDNLEYLDLSANNLGHAGSIALADWLLRVPGKCLRELRLANAMIEPAPILDAVRTNLSEVIECLDISFCRIDDHAEQILVSFIGKTRALKKLICVGCDLHGTQLYHMLQATKNNPNNVAFDFSNNRLSDKNACATFTKALSESTLSTISLREMDIPKANLATLIAAFATNHSLTSIDLSGNFKESKEKDTTALEALVYAVQNNPNLVELTLDGKGQQVLGKSVMLLFGMLGVTSKLRKLSLRSHGFGDGIAKELFDYLRWNTSLQVLDIDNNNTGLTAWNACKRCLGPNRTLTEIIYPVGDISRLVAKDKNAHEALRKVFKKITLYTENNKSGILDARGQPYSKNTTSFVRIRSTLKLSRSTFLQVNTDSPNPNQTSNGTFSSLNSSASSPSNPPLNGSFLSLSSSGTSASSSPIIMPPPTEYDDIPPAPVIDLDDLPPPAEDDTQEYPSEDTPSPPPPPPHATMMPPVPPLGSVVLRPTRGTKPPVRPNRG